MHFPYSLPYQRYTSPFYTVHSPPAYLSTLYWASLHILISCTSRTACLIPVAHYPPPLHCIAVGKDSYTNEGVSMDTCLGHCDATGNYHYHTNPGSGCVYNDTSGE
jgi:hypothetical protein